MKTKTDIKNALKTIGLQTVTVSVTSIDTKSLRVGFGIPAGHYGPMTLTNQWCIHVEYTKNDIASILRDLGLRKSECGWIFKETSRSITHLVMREMHYPTYARSQNLDPGYKTVWFVLDYYVEKKLVIS